MFTMALWASFYCCLSLAITAGLGSSSTPSALVKIAKILLSSTDGLKKILKRAKELEAA